MKGGAGAGGLALSVSRAEQAKQQRALAARCDRAEEALRLQCKLTDDVTSELVQCVRILALTSTLSLRWPTASVWRLYSLFTALTLTL